MTSGSFWPLQDSLPHDVYSIYNGSVADGSQNIVPDNIWISFSYFKKELKSIAAVVNSALSQQSKSLSGNAFSETLLNAISIGEYSSLKDYPQRASIWPELPEKARSGFVTATLVELLDDLASSKLSYNDLESELKKGVMQFVYCVIMGLPQ